MRLISSYKEREVDREGEAGETGVMGGGGEVGEIKRAYRLTGQTRGIGCGHTVQPHVNTKQDQPSDVLKTLFFRSDQSSAVICLCIHI